MALGANRINVIRMVLREAVLTVSAGLAIGIPISLAAGRAAVRAIPGLPPEDVRTVILGSAAMIAIAVAAAYVPARRAARVDPMKALRNE